MPGEPNQRGPLSSLLTGLAAGAATYSASGSWPKTAVWTVIGTVIGTVVTPFIRRVWQELEPQWAKQVAHWIEQRVSYLATGFDGKYRQHLLYKHRTFDVKGFSTQGPYALDLERIFVDLIMDPKLPADIPQDPTRSPKAEAAGARRDILAWMGGPARRNFAVIGAPGSGKTTLLKHLALLLSGAKPPVKLMPILLFLREHAAEIGKDPTIKLAALVESSLKDFEPPAEWFQKKLESGKCLVMMDGLDEVADPQLRLKVVRWVERQVENFGSNRFLVSSRPNGYRDNPLAGFSVLAVLPFRQEQVERFVRNWYLANEVMAHQKDDPGVRMAADHGADELLRRIRNSSNLQELAVNPLLLTLIATVHRYHSELPGRRVELYAQICEVFLGKRQLARGIELDLTAAQRIRVLRVLAYSMMIDELREIPAATAALAIAEPLALVTPNAQPATFLKAVEDLSGLLIERESGRYGFAHLTFQEYLASVHIKEERLENELIVHVGQPWWNETTRLYAAQADASAIVEVCLAGERPEGPALLLAADCANEALQLRADLRGRLKKLTEEAVEDPDPERRRLAAEFLLAQRLNNMARVDDDLYIDRSPMTHAEYQLFIDEIRAAGRNRQPDHWNSMQFPPGQGLLPVVGIRSTDASEFCEWLTQRTPSAWTYRLPRKAEITGRPELKNPPRLFCWVAGPDGVNVLLGAPPLRIRLSTDEIRTQLESDTRILLGQESGPPVVRAAARIILIDLLTLNPGSYVASELARARDQAFDREPLAVPRARYLARDRYLARERYLARDLGGTLPVTLNIDCGIAHDIALITGTEPLLAWYFLLEDRATGKAAAEDALWLVKARTEVRTRRGMLHWPLPNST